MAVLRAHAASLPYVVACMRVCNTRHRGAQHLARRVVAALVCAILCALGIYGVLAATSSSESQSRNQVLTEAQGVASNILNQVRHTHPLPCCVCCSWGGSQGRGQGLCDQGLCWSAAVGMLPEASAALAASKLLASCAAAQLSC